jgi:VanZ family protein
MALTSKREKRLWLWAAACQIAIYASLAYVRAPTEWLRERGLLRYTIGFFFLIAVVWIGVWLWRRRPSRGELLVIAGFALIYALVLLNMSRVEERAHFLQYGVVGGLIYAALRERRQNLLATGRPPGFLTRLPALTAIIVTGLLGWGDEGIQAVLPNRYYDLRDLVWNFGAGVLVVSAMASLRWARERELGRPDRG